MIELALLLLTAALGSTLARRLSLPTIPLVLFAGWLLTLTGFRLSEDLLAKTIELGVAFLAFASGIELDAGRPSRRLRLHHVTAACLLQILISIGIFFATARLLGFAPLPSIYLAIALSVSSTLIGTRQLRRLGQSQEPFARFTTRILLIQDATVVIVIALLATSIGGGGFSLSAALGVMLLFGAAVALRRHIARKLSRASSTDDETQLLFLLATLFSFLMVATFFHLPIVVGAFCAGLVYSRFPANGIVRGQLNSLTDFFAALFFTTLAQLSISPTGRLFGEAILLTALVIVSRFLLVYFLGRRSGLDGRSSAESGLLLSQVGEYGLILGLIALQTDIFGHHELALVSLVAAFTMMITPFVARDRIADLLLHLRRDRRSPGEGGHREWRDHVVMIGYGAGGKWVAHPLRDAKVELLVIDDDPAVVAELRHQGIACLLGDGADPAVLEAADVRRARAVIASLRRPSDALKVLRHVSGVPVIVRVFEDFEAEAVCALGGIPIRNSLAGAESFLDWFSQTQSIEGLRVG